MRILIINWRDAKHPRAGGADFRLQNVYAPLLEKGHEVILYSCAFKNCSKNAIINGIRVMASFPQVFILIFSPLDF